METETQLVADLIALNEKKVAMALDDLIKLSKKRNTKGKRSRRAKNNNRNFSGTARTNNSSKEKHYVNSLSGVRQGAVAKRRSSFKGNQFPVATNVARKSADVPQLSVRRRAFNIAGRMTSANQSRLLAPPVQFTSRFIAKRHEVEQKVENGGGKWKTLDSRFAIMKEQRKSNNNHNSGAVPRLPPWARARRFSY